MTATNLDVPPVLLLAAGRGTRLGEIGRQTPKVLVRVQGKPLLSWHLEHLAAEGATRVIINAHHLHEQILDYVARYDGPLHIDVSVESELLGTAGAAVNNLGALNPRFLVLYGDVMLFEPLLPVVREHITTSADVTLCVYAAESTHDKGIVDCDAHMRVTAFAEKNPARTGPGLVNAGLYVVETSALAGYAVAPLDFAHDVFPDMLTHGRSVQAYLLHDPVLDIGTPDALRTANDKPAS